MTDRRVEADREREALRAQVAVMSGKRIANFIMLVGECRYYACVYLDGAERELARQCIATFSGLLLPALASFEAEEKQKEDDERKAQNKAAK